jgi:sulfatase modifying factor 1
MDSLFLEKWETYNGKRMLDVKQLKYKYTWFDAEGGSKESKTKSD